MSQGSPDGWRDAITDLFALAQALDQPGMSKNTEMVGGVRLGASQFLHKFGDAFFLEEQRLHDAQTGFIGQGFQHRGALTRREQNVSVLLFHQQQLSLGEQVTASPLTVLPARLRTAKCGA